MSKKRTNSQKQDKKTKETEKMKKRKKRKKKQEEKKGKQGLQEPYLVKKIDIDQTKVSTDSFQRY